MKVGFAGSGSMAAALARGVAARAEGVELSFSDAGSGRATELATALGGRALPLADQASESELIVLAVKPGALGVVAGELAAYRGPVVSLLGATSLDRLGAALPGRPLLRAMPNVAVEVGRGVICHAPATEPEALAPALELLARVATVVELPEDQLDAATAVMGCSPAYLAVACRALAEAGTSAGLGEELSWELVSLTAAGTGELLLGRAPEEVARAVASPGGSTEAGLKALTERGAEGAFAAAVDASLARMRGER